MNSSPSFTIPFPGLLETTGTIWDLLPYVLMICELADGQFTYKSRLLLYRMGTL